MTEPITPAACATIIARSLAVGATLTERLLDLPPDSPRNPAADYGHLSRAMRQSILLLERLARPAPVDERPARRADARQQIIRAVEDAITYRSNGRDPDALRAELLERLDDEALEIELETRPVADIIAEFCRDLRVISPIDAPQFKRRTPADMAALRALAAERPGLARSHPAVKRPAPDPRPPANAIPAAEPTAPSPARLTRRPPLSTPSLILPTGARYAPSMPNPEADTRDRR